MLDLVDLLGRDDIGLVEEDDVGEFDLIGESECQLSDPLEPSETCQDHESTGVNDDE